MLIYDQFELKPSEIFQKEKINTHNYLIHKLDI